MKNISPKQRIIFPLDVPAREEAISFARLLKDHVGVFKIGLELFVSSGPAVIEAIKAEAPEAKIFLDLKFHDVPETVGRAYRSAVKLGVDFVTVHCDTGELVKALADEKGKTRVLGITLLTSLSSGDLTDMGIDPKFKEPGELVLHRANIAKLSCLDGVVCSALEAKAVKERFGEDFIVVTPGIRPSGEVKADDQKRTSTPYQAVVNGADYIVVGRPIRDAKDPVGAARDIAGEIGRAIEIRTLKSGQSG
jgi:orotidine-5'-phosphate decarboxylase